MPWVYLLLAVAALALAMLTKSFALTLLCLLAALVLVVLFTLGLLADRVDARSRDVATVLDPQELQRLREQVEARRLAKSTTERDAPTAGNE